MNCFDIIDRSVPLFTVLQCRITFFISSLIPFGLSSGLSPLCDPLTFRTSL